MTCCMQIPTDTVVKILATQTPVTRHCLHLKDTVFDEASVASHVVDQLIALTIILLAEKSALVAAAVGSLMMHNTSHPVVHSSSQSGTAEQAGSGATASFVLDVGTGVHQRRFPGHQLTLALEECHVPGIDKFVNSLEADLGNRQTPHCDF